MFITVVPDGSAYVVERLGRYHRTLNPGLNILVPVIDRVAFRYSLLSKDEPLTDNCITRDNVAISIATTLRWQILDARRAAYESANVADFVTGLVRKCQRQWIAERSWDEVRENTRDLQHGVVRLAADSAAETGAKIERLDVKRIARV